MEWIDLPDSKETYKSYLKKVSDGDIELKEFFEAFTSQKDRTDILWLLKDEVKEGNFVELSLQIAEEYSEDPNPDSNYRDLNQKYGDGDELETMPITTVRGTVPWLLQALVITLRTDLYKRIIDVIEKLSKDSVYYVRMQALVPLGMLAANYRATKNTDGTPFDFPDEERKRIPELAFAVLRENRELPQVLAYSVKVFDKIRTLDEAQARELLTTLFYKPDTEELAPKYLTSAAAPLAMYFAVYRSDDAEESFDATWFENFLYELIRKGNESQPRLASTILWHTWKEIEEHPNSYRKFKKYIPHFFEGLSDDYTVSQFEFLIKTVLKHERDYALTLFTELLTRIAGTLSVDPNENFDRFISAEELVEAVAISKPDALVQVYDQLTRIALNNFYIGDTTRIFNAYRLVPEQYSQLKEQAHESAKQNYGRIREKFARWNLPALEE